MALDAACEHVSADGSVAKYRQRSAYVAAYVLDRANGFCGVCGRPAPFRRPDGGAYLEPHHVIRLSDDDPDHPSMVTAACPACHRRVHYGEDGQATNNRLKAHVPAVEQAIADGRFIIVTAAAIRNDDGRVLIVQKGGHGTIAGKWESPCGKAELGETLEGCLKREILEELGVEIGDPSSLHMTDHDYGRVFVRLFAFGCRIVNGTLALKEHVQDRWTSVEKLLESDLASADVSIANALRRWC